MYNELGDIAVLLSHYYTALKMACKALPAAALIVCGWGRHFNGVSLTCMFQVELNSIGTISYLLNLGFASLLIIHIFALSWTLVNILFYSSELCIDCVPVSLQHEM